MDASQRAFGSQLKSELAKYCLPAASRDPNRKLAWANSICLLFLLIGLFGSKPASVSIKPLPVAEEVIQTIIEPVVLPPPTTTVEPTPDQNDRDKPDTPQVVVVTPEAPNISFSVPTIGNLVVPNAMASAPPLTPLRQPDPVRRQPAAIGYTGEGGDRPKPNKYPALAEELGQQGTVVLSITADENGTIASIQIKESSGYPILDRDAYNFVKRHWTLPPGPGIRIFEAPITYELKSKTSR